MALVEGECTETPCGIGHSVTEGKIDQELRKIRYFLSAK